jgi:hypothetical protein
VASARFWVLSMRTNSPTRHTSIATVFAIMALALAVLGWGTGYKLSLYDPPGSPSASMPHAKLLSQRERPPATTDASEVAPASLHSRPTTFNPGVIAVVLVLGLAFEACFRVQSLEVGAACRQVRFNSNFFSFRPPPASFLSQVEHLNRL